MPLKIANAPEFTGDGDITKTQIDELRQKYVSNTGKIRRGNDRYDDFDENKHTVWGWFSLKEIIDFLSVNGVVLTPANPVDDYGIRIYFGMHHPDNSYQPKREGIPPTDYHFHDTPIFVLTKKGKYGNNEDQLNTTNFISLAPFNPGDGMDNAQLCPPECRP
jgi:hypothetical protein